MQDRRRKTHFFFLVINFFPKSQAGSLFLSSFSSDESSFSTCFADFFILRICLSISTFQLFWIHPIFCLRIPAPSIFVTGSMSFHIAFIGKLNSGKSSHPVRDPGRQHARRFPLCECFGTISCTHG